MKDIQIKGYDSKFSTPSRELCQFIAECVITNTQNFLLKKTKTVLHLMQAGFSILFMIGGIAQADYDIKVHRSSPAIVASAALSPYAIEIHRRRETAEASPTEAGLLARKTLADATETTETDVVRYAVKLQTAKKQAMASGVNTSAGIVTCAHVVEGHSEFVAVCDGETATAKVISVDKKNDLALLSVIWKQRHSEAKLASGDPAKDERIRSVGRQKDGTLSVESHAFLKRENNEYQYSNPPQEGRSGSGIFDSSGKLVGIVLGKIVDVEPYVGRSATVDDVAKITRQASRNVAAASAGDSHSHQCPKCGKSWSHTSASFGSIAEHTCPACGQIVWQQSAGAARAVTQTKPVASCPNGNCPLIGRRRRA
jgi:hypothetical protein